MTPKISTLTTSLGSPYEKIGKKGEVYVIKKLRELVDNPLLIYKRW